MTAALIVLLLAASTETEAPTMATGPEAQPDVESVASTLFTTIVAPPAAIVAGTVVGIVSSFALGYVLPGQLAALSGFLVGVLGFEATLGLMLYAFLPPLPEWTVPIALVAATVVGGAGMALSAGASLLYLTYSGSDGCGPEMYIMPLAIFTTTTVGASTATTLTVIVAESE